MIEQEQTYKNSKKRGKVPIIIGIVLLCAALGLVGFNVVSGMRAKAASEDAYARVLQIMNSLHDKYVSSSTFDPNMEMPTVDVDGYDYIGVLEIPSLELTLPVMGTWSYDRLALAPCRYAGTAYKAGFVIAGHNYIQHFGPIGDVAYDDTVRFTDVEGRTFEYRVREVISLASDAVDDMTTDAWDLSLFTCNLSGLERITVRCELVSASVNDLRLGV